ncbi:MAG TPA: Gldg family protein [Polyangiaceae bacterium]|nr:Gldg family protein [Polyangiaceae bacterium]
MSTQEHKRKVATQTGLYLAVVAAIIVAVNVLAAGVYARKDVTKNERYTLSQGSGRLVKSLKTPIQVDAYVTKGLAQLDGFVRDLTDLLKEYERAGGGKFKFTIIEAKTDELREQAKEAGLQEMAFGETSATGEDQASIAQGYQGLVFKYGSEKGVIPQLQPGHGEGLEFWITNKIREVRDKADDIKHRIGVITGKDELKLSDTNLVPKQGGRGGGSPSIQTILEQAFPFYKIEEVDLKGGDSEIDAALDGVMITQPQKPYTDKELRRIDEFLMRGGKSLAVFASAVTMKPNDPSMNVSLDLHGLDKLLLGYGLDMKKNAVFDYGAQFRLPIMTQTGGATWIRHPGIAHVTNDVRLDDEEKLLDTGFAAFFRLEELAFPFASSIQLLKDKQPKDVKVYAVARSTPAAGVETTDTIDMKLKPEWRPKPPYEQRVIAAVAEGKLKSSYAGSPMEGVKPNERAPTDSRVLVVASSMFLTNPFAYAGNGPDMGGQFAMMGGVGGDPQLQMFAGPYAQRYLTNTILSVKNTLDWMSGDTDLLATSAKILRDPNLTYASISKPKIEAEDDEAAIKKKDEEYRQSRKKVQRSVQWTLTLGIPVFFAAFGVLRWRRRESRKNQKFI